METVIADKINEIRQRCTRIETRIMLLASALGVNLRPEEDFEIDVEARTVRLQTLDVPYTSVINACHKAGLFSTKVRVHFNENAICEMYV